MALDRLIAIRGAPAIIMSDNGPDFTLPHYDEWAFQRRIQLDYIRPAKPAENGHIESFNGKLRDECLDANWFGSLPEDLDGPLQRVACRATPSSSRAAARVSTSP
jgi:putative transposase